MFYKILLVDTKAEMPQRYHVKGEGCFISYPTQTGILIFYTILPETYKALQNATTAVT